MSVKKFDISKNYLPIDINEDIIEKTMEEAQEKGSWVIAIVIGTKPCFYKLYGSIIEAEKQGLPYIIINSDQHYDSNLTHGIKEFQYDTKVGFNLNIRGGLVQKSMELFGKIEFIANYLKEKWPNVTVVPVVNGDTIMCGIVPPAWMFTREERAIHNEAGLRSMAPTVISEAEKVSPEEFVEKQFNGDWKLLTNEPFPEQWDSYIGSKGSEYLFAPLEINKQHLLREGYPEENIFITGGVVVEAFEKKMKEKPTQSIFEIYPQLKEGKWLRFDIHRKANQSESRMRAIISCVKKLVEGGHKVNFIEMNTTRQSMDKYGLRGEIEKLRAYKNFLFTQVWPEYAQVLEFYKSKNCLAAVTDSGGVQEEMNLLGKPCLTVRFNTDRPETVMQAKSNILVPPISGEFMFNLIDYIVKNEELLNKMENSEKLYGTNVAKKFISIIKQLSTEKRRPFSWAHHQLGYN